MIVFVSSALKPDLCSCFSLQVVTNLSEAADNSGAVLELSTKQQQMDLLGRYALHCCCWDWKRQSEEGRMKALTLSHSLLSTTRF